MANNNNDVPTSGPQPKFGNQEFTEEELDIMRRKLEEKIEAKHISYRKGHDGGQIPYLETNKAISFANDIFKPGNWASQVVNLSVDYIEETPAGKYNSGVSAIVRVQLRDGTYHEDIGYGSADNQRSKATALELAKKSAVSDGIKRALRCFGNALGNSMSDKEHLKNMKAGAGKPPAKVSPYGNNQPQLSNNYNNNMNNNMNNNQQQNTYPQQQNNNYSNNNNNSQNRNLNDTNGGMASGSNNNTNNNNNNNNKPNYANNPPPANPVNTYPQQNQNNNQNNQFNNPNNQTFQPVNNTNNNFNQPSFQDEYYDDIPYV